MPIPVTAHPGTKAEKRREMECVSGVVLFQCAPQRFVDLRNHGPKPRRNGKATFHLLQHRWAMRAEKRGLPENGDLSAKAVFQIAPFARDQVFPVELPNVFAHSAELRANRAPLGFARVRREDEIDRKAAERLLHLSGVEAA